MTDEETLGEREAVGRISPTVAATLEKTLGCDWRAVSVEEGLAAIAQAFSHTNATVVATAEWMPSLDTLIRRLAAGEAMSDALIASAIREVYGDTPTAEQMHAVLEVVETYDRAQHGEEPLEPDT